MAFKIALSPTYEVEVEIEYPVEGGGTRKDRFFARFKRLPQDELEQLMAEVVGGKARDRALLLRVLAGWRGVQDENGAELAFSEAVRDQVLQVHPMQPTLVRAYMASVAAAREKN